MLFLTFRRGRRGPEIETAVVARGDIVQSIFASGEVKSKNQRELKFRANGEVVTVKVSAGEEVVKNQFLVSLDQRELQESLRQAEWNLQKARADLDYYGETRRLFREEHKYDGPSEELFAQFGQYDAQVRGAEKAVEKYDSLVESARLALEKSLLISPIAGTVVEVNIKEGENYSGSTAAVIVAGLSKIIFEAEVDESDIGKIVVGQKVVIELDAYPDDEFKGEVVEIGRMVALDSAGNKVVEVEIKLKRMEEDKKELLLGLSGEAEIILQEEQDVLLVPVEAVFLEDGKDYVFVVKDAQPVKRQLELGLENDDVVEALSGVRQGEKVVVGNLPL